MELKPEIIELLLAGKTDREIAATVGCSLSYPSMLRLEMGMRSQRQAPMRDAILAYLQANPSATCAAVAKALGTHYETVSRARSWAAKRKSA
ncbi:hypothetical protein [Pseudomonas oryzihabitans]|uniref:hypothetical protein n=1 Tax=Pseudomonas oryzihabitans TaxID=47885 RepID=UPI00119D988B|nr:hypothetical protein [Pseudomonas oryzihabitans]